MVSLKVRLSLSKNKDAIFPHNVNKDGISSYLE